MDTTPSPLPAPSFLEIMRWTEEQARAYLETIRWPSGPACPHCGSVAVTRLHGTAHRAGVLKCRDCKQQFTVTVGTIFESSHIPLSKWVAAFHMVCASKKGVSALQLQRQLSIGSYKTAWFMAHRIRYAMAHEPLSGVLLGGTVEVDETYVGGKPRPEAHNRHPGKKGRSGKATKKTPVVALVERGGRVRALPIGQTPSAADLRDCIRKNVNPDALLNTDESNLYTRLGREWKGGHRWVRHATEYVASDGTHINTAESWFALFKRAYHGAWHHVSKDHLHRYVGEVAYRWNQREVTDAVRTARALSQGDGVRLTYVPLGTKSA